MYNLTLVLQIIAYIHILLLLDLYYCLSCLTYPGQVSLALYPRPSGVSNHWNGIWKKFQLGIRSVKYEMTLKVHNKRKTPMPRLDPWFTASTPTCIKLSHLPCDLMARLVYSCVLSAVLVKTKKLLQILNLLVPKDIAFVSSKSGVD